MPAYRNLKISYSLAIDLLHSLTQTYASSGQNIIFHTVKWSCDLFCSSDGCWTAEEPLNVQFSIRRWILRDLFTGLYHWNFVSCFAPRMRQPVLSAPESAQTCILNSSKRYLGVISARQWSIIDDGNSCDKFVTIEWPFDSHAQQR